VDIYRRGNSVLEGEVRYGKTVLDYDAGREKE